MTPTDGELPTTFGKYLLTERLATGGMAEIYLAKLVGPSGFEKQLVIKQIHRSLSGQRPFVDLFVAEAKTLVALTHGNIVPVYELGVVGDTYFIAMEYIDGPTLYRLTERAIQRGQRIAPPVAAWIAARILEGLDYAHRKGDGVIHRDLSPRNVMLSRDGEVKLVDFGIAVTLGAAGDATTAPPTGSFPYMSPEQVRRGALTPQTDLFSLGVVLWEMLVGERLFARDDPDATLAAVTDAPIERPAARVPEVPEVLDAIAMRALDRDRATRWSSAADMLAALQKYLYGIAEPPTPRDVAALVARYCPPETRRQPTNLPIEPAGEPGADGPRTAVIPRPAARSFATHHALDQILEPARTDRPPDGYQPLRLKMPGRDAPSRGALVFVGLGGVALTIGAIVIFLRGRDAVLADDAPPDAMQQVDARSIDAAVDGPIPADAEIASDAAIVDAPPRTDAAPRTLPTVVMDAALATGTLKLGADPWAEITVDGASHGRTPATIEVPIGRHTVELTFPGEPVQKKSFTIDVHPAEVVPVQAAFTP